MDERRPGGMVRMAETLLTGEPAAEIPEKKSV